MSELAALAEVFQTFGGYAFAAVMTIFYVKEKSYSRKLTVDLVSHAEKQGEHLAKMAGAAEASKETNQKLDSQSQAITELAHKVDMLPRSEGGQS